MTTYTFKPALLRSPQYWALEGAQLKKLEPEGAVIDLSKLTAVRFGDIFTGKAGMWNAELALEAEGRKHLLGCTDRLQGENRRQFLSLCLNIVEQLAQVNPEITISETKALLGMGWMFAIFGAGGILGGLRLIIPSLLNLSERGSGLLIGFGVVALLLGGLFLLAAGTPWKKQPPKTPDQAAGWIRRVMAM